MAHNGNTSTRRSSSFTRFGGGGEKCQLCGKSVFAAERMAAQEKVYHTSCFRCSDCNVKLGASNWCMDATGQLWCRPHFQQAMSASGGKYDLGAADGETPISRRNSMVVAPEAAPAPGPPRTPAPPFDQGMSATAARPDSAAPAPAPAPARSVMRVMRSSSFGRFGGGGEKCARCAKVVYAAERVKAKEQVFHNTCFRCLECNVKLGPSSWCMDLSGGIYCKPHFMQTMRAGGGKYDFSSGNSTRNSSANPSPAPVKPPPPAPASAEASGLVQNASHSMLSAQAQRVALATPATSPSADAGNVQASNTGTAPFVRHGDVRTESPSAHLASQSNSDQPVGLQPQASTLYMSSSVLPAKPVILNASSVVQDRETPAAAAKEEDHPPSGSHLSRHSLSGSVRHRIRRNEAWPSSKSGSAPRRTYPTSSNSELAQAAANDTTTTWSADTGYFSERVAKPPTEDVSNAGASRSDQLFLVLGVCGSLRGASTNGGLLRAAAARVQAIGHQFRLADISQLPLYSADYDQEGSQVPQAVETWRSAVASADVLLFASPEHNYCITAALKNAIDWASTVPRLGNLWTGKPGAVFSAGGAAGGARGQLALRQIAAFIDVTLVNAPEVAICRFKEQCFDEVTGDLISETWKERVHALVDRVMVMARAMHGAGLGGK